MLRFALVRERRNTFAIIYWLARGRVVKVNFGADPIAGYVKESLAVGQETHVGPRYFLLHAFASVEIDLFSRQAWVILGEIGVFLFPRGDVPDAHAVKVANHRFLVRAYHAAHPHFFVLSEGRHAFILLQVPNLRRSILAITGLEARDNQPLSVLGERG